MPLKSYILIKLWVNIIRVRGLFLFFALYVYVENSLIARAEVQMAAEFEFDLNYFEKFLAPIKKYIKTPRNKNAAITLDPKAYFQISDSAPPEVKELLGRFEFDWELVFAPPKVEIRHKTPHSTEQVRKDIHALLRLFSRNEKEYQKLLLHLSSIKAETPDQKHLNLHIHASGQLEEPRLELFKKHQILTALELLATNSPEDALRVFDSTHSSYQENIWSKGIDRVLHFERIESRKRAVSIDTDLTELDKLFSLPYEQLDSQYNMNIEALATESVLKKVVSVVKGNVFDLKRIYLIQDLFLVFPDDLAFKKSLWDKIAGSSLKFIHDSIASNKYGATPLDHLKFLLTLRHKAPLNDQEKVHLETLITERLSGLTFFNQSELISWISLSFKPHEIKKILESPYFASFHIKFHSDLTKKPTNFELQEANLAAHIFSIADSGASVPWNEDHKRIKKEILNSSSRNTALMQSLGRTYMDHPVEFIRNLSSEHQDVFFENIKAIEQKFYDADKELHEQTKRFRSKGTLCKDLL